MPKRCLVEATIITDKKERSFRLGPGLVITEEQYAELVEAKEVLPSWFEDYTEPEEAVIELTTEIVPEEEGE